MLTACLMSALILPASIQAEEDKETFWPEVLVRAKAVRVVYEKRLYWQDPWQEVTFRIEYVYRGDPKLKTTTFQGHFTRHSRMHLEDELNPFVKEGEVGIWQLISNDGRLIIYGPNHGTYEGDGLLPWNMSIPVPARKILGGSANNIDYTVALKWACIVETASKARPAERPKFLRQYVFSNNPYVAAWSIQVLAAEKPTDLIPFLEKLADDPKVAVAGQVTIDEILWEINRDKWVGSRRRAALFDRWVSGDIIRTHDLQMIIARFHYALENDQLDLDTWLPLIEKWVVRQHFSEGLLYKLYSAYPATDKRHIRERQRIITYALRLLEKSVDEETRAYAAHWLEHLGKVSAEEVKIVKAARDKCTTPHVRLILGTVIRESIAPRHPSTPR